MAPPSPPPGETGVPLLSAVMVGTIIQAMLYGVFLVLCLRSFQVLRDRSRQAAVGLVHWLTVIVTISEFIIITAHFGINSYRLTQAFLYAETPVLYYATVSNPVYVAYTALYVFQGVTTDCFLTYRTYIIWQRNFWLCIPPILSNIALAVCGSGILITFAHFITGVSVFKSDSQPYIVASLGCSLFTNVYCSSMITLRIWTSERRLNQMNVGRVGQSHLTSTMHIIIDSAFFFTAITVAAFVSYICQSNIHFLFVDLATPTIGITFCMIIVRVGGNVDENSANGTGVDTTIHANSKIMATSRDRQRSIPMAPMRVHITREVHEENEDGSLSRDDIKTMGDEV